jgi:hypothetical protein
VIDEVQMLDCGLCGSAIVSSTPGLLPGWYSDGESITCGDCHAVNHVSCDSETEPYVSYYDCRHGKPDTDACDLCEIEEGGGVGEVAP